MMTAFDPEVWAQTQPHTFFSHWPTAKRTKCDFCGVYFEFHAEPVAEEDNVARHATRAIKGGSPTWKADIR